MFQSVLRFTVTDFRVLEMKIFKLTIPKASTEDRNLRFASELGANPPWAPLTSAKLMHTLGQAL